jgi:hypothetical protein
LSGIGIRTSRPASPAHPATISTWTYCASKLHQEAYVGLVFAPAAELWQGGFPEGVGDWSEVERRAWIVEEGELWSTVISEQDPSIYAFEARQHAMREAQAIDELIRTFEARQKILREESNATAAASGDA